MSDRQPMINLLPEFEREYAEIKAVADALQPYVDARWDSQSQMIENAYTSTADEDAIARYERMYKIVPAPNATIEERKFAIAVHCAEMRPFTFRQAENMLKALCGNFKLDIDYAARHLAVKLGLASANNFGDVEQFLNKMKPANMTMSVDIMFNRNSALAKFTHSQLAAHTHEQLRSEVFE